MSSNEKISAIIEIGPYMIFFLGAFLFIVITTIYSKLKNASDKQFKKRSYGYKNNKKIDFENIMPFREIPCNKDIYYASVIPYLNNMEYNNDNIIGAMLLKFQNEKKIKIEKDLIKIISMDNCENNSEEKLLEIMRKATMHGDSLLPKDLKAYCENNYQEFDSFIKGIRNEELYKLKKAGHIYERKDSTECSQKNVLDDKIYEDTIKLLGLEKFLNEFSLMDEKEIKEIVLWDEYLIFAYLFGIADKVSSKLNQMNTKDSVDVAKSLSSIDNIDMKNLMLALQTVTAFSQVFASFLSATTKD